MSERRSHGSCAAVVLMLQLAEENRSPHPDSYDLLAIEHCINNRKLGQKKRWQV
jgi:hypothetical protein